MGVLTEEQQQDGGNILHFSIFRKFGNDLAEFAWGCCGDLPTHPNPPIPRKINTAHIFDRVLWCVGWFCITSMWYYLLVSNEECSLATANEVYLPPYCVIMGLFAAASMILLGVGGCTLFVDFMDCLIDFCKFGTVKHKFQ